MDQDYVSVGDHLAVLRGRWRVLVLCALLGLVAGFSYSLSQPTLYEAEAKVLAVPGPTADPEGQMEAEQVATQAEIVLSDRIVAGVKDSISFKATGQELIDATSVVPLEGTSVLVITGQGKTAKSAAAVSNGFARSYLAFRADQVTAKQDLLTKRLALLQERIAAIQESLPDLLLAERPGAQATLAGLTARATDLEGQIFLADPSAASERRKPLQLANPPDQPVQPRPLWDVGLGLFLGLIGGVVITYATKRSDKGRTVDDSRRGARTPSGDPE